MRQLQHSEVSATPPEAARRVALRLDRLSKRYGPVIALDTVTLDVHRGEFLTLLGPSGSGKSTTLLLIAGFETPAEGDIYMDGASLLGVPPQRRRIGMVFQNYALFPHLTVFENIAFGPRTARWSDAQVRARVDELLELVSLQDYGHRVPAELSGGQQQRVALARALATKPEILLLDEPLGALDRKLREQMLAEFRRIHRIMNTTMVYITHDQEEALTMSDRVAVMNHGRIIQLGTPRDLYEHPRNAFVANFIGASNILEGVALAENRISLNGWELTVSHERAAGTPVQLMIRPERIIIGTRTDWNATSATIEDVSYLGDAIVYRVLTKQGQRLLVKDLTRRTGVEYRLDESVTVSWHPDDARLVAE